MYMVITLLEGTETSNLPDDFAVLADARVAVLQLWLEHRITGIVARECANCHAVHDISVSCHCCGAY
jgi:hypothetical protein